MKIQTKGKAITQVVNVKVHAAEPKKPRRRKAQPKKKPAPFNPPPPYGPVGGGGGGGGPMPFIPVALPRVAPISQSDNVASQLVRPIMSTAENLLGMERRMAQIENQGLSDRIRMIENRFDSTRRNILDMMAQYYQSESQNVPRGVEVEEVYSAAPLPAQPLVLPESEPIVSSRPISLSDGKEEAARPEASMSSTEAGPPAPIEEEEEDLEKIEEKTEPRQRRTREQGESKAIIPAADLQQMRDRGEITRSFLNKYNLTLRKGQKATDTMTLHKIASSLRIIGHNAVTNKDSLINLILDNMNK